MSTTGNPEEDKCKTGLRQVVGLQETLRRSRSRVPDSTSRVESPRSRIYRGRDCLRRYLQGLPVTERNRFRAGVSGPKSVVVDPSVTPLIMNFVTRGHVEIPSSRATGARGVEVKGCAIARQRRTSVVVRRVDCGPQIYGS